MEKAPASRRTLPDFRSIASPMTDWAMNYSKLRDEVRARTRLPRTGPSPRGVVVTYSPDAVVERQGHMARARTEIARRLATLTGFVYAGDYDPRRHRTSAYFVPSDTLTLETAARIGIRREEDLFGGVVPHRYVATKTITHPLVDPSARAPDGWRAEFPRRVAEVVLAGYSAFTKEDARKAGQGLLEQGAVRVKPGAGIAGLGQSVAETAADLADAIDAIESEALSVSGVVVERNLADVTTCSVGQVRVAEYVGTYYGTQIVTTNHHGAEVYGGSDLVVVRGGFNALLALPLSDHARLAIVQAREYDTAARECFAGLYASRRNYDVAQGREAAGALRSGVLEQSWRLGGASGAEIAALEAFRADPSLAVVRAKTREIYDEAPAVPADAVIYFSGVDPHVGPLTKYALTEPDADT
jgi:hypothetical protein